MGDQEPQQQQQQKQGGSKSRGGGRGGGGGQRGRGGSSGGRGGGSGGGNKQGHGRPLTGGPSLPKKENILDLGKYMEKRVSVKFAGGRTVTGLLKGFDPLLNIVIDDTEEELVNHETGATYSKRSLGLVVCRGTTISLIAPVDGTEEIANPFV